MLNNRIFSYSESIQQFGIEKLVYGLISCTQKVLYKILKVRTVGYTQQLISPYRSMMADVMVNQILISVRNRYLKI